MMRIRKHAATCIALLAFSTSATAQEVPAEATTPTTPTATETTDVVTSDATVATDTPQEDTKPAPVAEKPVEALVPELPNPTVETTAAADVSNAWNSNLKDFENRFQWRLKVGGYIRTGYTWIQDDPDNDLYGRNDGFVLANARLSISGDMRKAMGFLIQFDGAVDRDISGSVRPVSEVDTRVRDAVLWWKPVEYVRVTAGQFKPPFDAEEAYSRAEQLFIQNSVASIGVGGVDGFNVQGLSRDREAGAMLDADPIFFAGEEGFGARYALAATNGSPANLALNDNQSLALYGRLELMYGKIARIGGAGFTNNETLRPEAADQIDRDAFGWTADLTVNVAGVTVLGSVISTKYTYDSLAVQPEVTALGYQASIAYQEPFFGIQPTFRYASYDPSSSTSGQGNNLIFEEDDRTYYTVGLNYNPKYPIRVMVNYTITNEGKAIELDNDRLDALLQLMW